MTDRRIDFSLKANLAVLARFHSEGRGAAAVEFSLLAPVMVAMFFGLAEFRQAFMADKRMGHASAQVADIVAQTDAVTTDELADVFALGQLVIAPFPTAPLKMRVSSVTRDANGVAKVDWSRGSGITARAAGATVTLPAGLIVNGESIIMSEATYDYVSPVSYLMPGTTQFANTYYLRPRLVSKVGCSDC